MATKMPPNLAQFMLISKTSKFQTCPLLSIGETREQSVLSRIKDIVDLVGLLQQLKPSNPTCKSTLETQQSKSFQLNTSPLAHQMNSPAVELEDVRDLFPN